MTASASSQIHVRLPPESETDPEMDALVAQVMPGLRLRGRYRSLIDRDPEFGRAVDLLTVVLGYAVPSTGEESEILDEAPSRWRYFQFLLGAVRVVMARCDQPPGRAGKLLAAAWYYYHLDDSPAFARRVAREALVLEGAPELDAAFAAGRAAATAWLDDPEMGVDDCFRVFSLDGVLGEETGRVVSRH